MKARLAFKGNWRRHFDWFVLCCSFGTPMNNRGTQCNPFVARHAFRTLTRGTFERGRQLAAVFRERLCPFASSSVCATVLRKIKTIILKIPAIAICRCCTLRGVTPISHKSRKIAHLQDKEATMLKISFAFVGCFIFLRPPSLSIHSSHFLLGVAGHVIPCIKPQ